MYRNEKRALLGICETLYEIHETLEKTADQRERIELLDAAQQGAIRIGESIEAEDKERYADTIFKLEEYCERIYELSTKEIITEGYATYLNKATDEIYKVVKGIKCRLKIAFFPYKAEMWDSLESFYLAAKEDPESDVFLVPIPYYELSQSDGDAQVKYDIDRFPIEEEPVPYYRFDHTDGSVDIAYVHNPYDGQNLVTSVHPDYYSHELKKYVSKLIYAPYYVTSGYVADEQLNMPVLHNADFIVLQNELAKNECKGMDYYDRILPFGSSKFDFIIQKCKQGVSMPESWREVIGSRRTLMLNSSLNDLLSSDEAAFEKLEFFFELMRGNDKIAVIWRPHPLYESTLRSLRPNLIKRYEKLKEFFMNERIGVFDSTPDISDTIAIADGYVGSGASSVINMFAVTGKPVFIFNNNLREHVSDHDRRVLQLDGLEYFRGRYYMKPCNINAIFSINADNLSETLKYEGSIPDTVEWTNGLTGLIETGGKLYMSPFFVDDAVRFDPIMKTVEKLGAAGRQYHIGYPSFGTFWPSKKSIVFIPNTKYLIMEYVIDKGIWIYNQIGLAELNYGLERPSYIGIPYGGSTYNDTLFYSTGISNRILKMEQGNGKYEIFYLGKPEPDCRLHFVLRGASDEGLWVGQGGSSDIMLAPWEYLSDISKWKIFTMPDGYEYSHDGIGDPAGSHGGILEYGDSIYITPFKSPHMIRIDRNTMEITYIAEDFFRDSEKKGIGYELKFSGICGSSCRRGLDRWVVQKRKDLHIGIINLCDGSYEEFVPEIPKELFDKLVPDDAGFYKGDEYDSFKMVESRLFSIEHFLDVFSKGGYDCLKKKQIEEMETIAANLDGTCGIKTHEFLKRVIEEEDIL